MSAPTTEEPKPARKFCQMCGEYYDDEKDPNHLEACRDARKP